jgi:hypothetical protein
MRKAAGIILIIVSVVLLVGMVIDMINMSDFDVPIAILSVLLATISPRVVLCGLVVAGGVLCLKRRHWGVCLVSAVITLAFRIIPAAALSTDGDLAFMWRGWVVAAGALISAIFISIRKREWQEISDSVDGKVSDSG